MGKDFRTPISKSKEVVYIHLKIVKLSIVSFTLKSTS